jgi:hypothetical protein
MIKSSYTGTTSLKYGLIIMGSCLIIAAIIVLAYSPKLQQEDYTVYNTDWSDSIILFCIGCALILVNLLYISRIKNISMSLDKLSIHEGEDYINYSWTEVEKIKFIPFLMPTSYWLRLKASKEIIVFASNGTQGKYVKVELNGFMLLRDFSEMGKTIRKVKKTYMI